MAKYNAEVNCPGCGLKTRVVFKKPSFLQPTFTEFNCESCGSLIFVKFDAPRPGDKKPAGTVGVSARVKAPSDLLVKMKAEEAEHNAAKAKELENAEAPSTSSSR